jgi:hypothetical protein
MLSSTLKRSRAETYGTPHPTPIAVVAGAFRRAWVRVAGLGHGERRALEHVAAYSGDLDTLLAQHDVRHARPVDGSQRVFRAPGLVYSPPAHRLPVRGSRSVVVAVEASSGARVYSR